MSHFLDLSLFLGLPLSSSCQEALDNANPHLVALLTSGELYLNKITHNKTGYLGKFSSKMATLDELEHLHANVVSLLKKLMPNQDISPNALQLLALNDLK